MRTNHTVTAVKTRISKHAFASPRRLDDEDDPRPLTTLWREAAQALDARRARQAALAKTSTAPAVLTPQEILRERAKYQFD